jgi:thyroid stimulating hormone receptor
LKTQRFIADMQAKYCDKIPENDSFSLRFGQEYEKFGIDVNVHSHLDNKQDGGDIEVFHTDPFQTPLNRELLFHAFCGNLTYAHRGVRCTPQPDAFK